MSADTNMNVENQKAVYYPHIDGMRALAVLSVILYHLNGAWLPGGFAGVDVFFVISGFVVSASVVRLNAVSFRQFLLQFYVRRIQRIVPALMLCLVVTAVLSALFIPSAWLSNKNRTTGLAAFFGFSNFVLGQSGNDYFSPTAEFNPYTHTWSLGVEEQFYLLFPMLFFPWLRGGAARVRAVRLFAAAALLSLGIGCWLAWSNPLLSFYMIFSRFWELAGGVLLYQWMAQRAPDAAPPHPMVRRLGLPLSLLMLLLALGCSRPADFPFPGALPAVLGTLGLLYFLNGRPAGDRLLRCFTHPLPVFIGKISYSLYLWHWPVFVLFKWTVGVSSPACQASAVLLAFLLAIASYHLVENRIRHSSWLQLLPRPRRLAAGLALIMLSFSLSVAISKTQTRLSQSTVSRNVGLWDPHLYQYSNRLGDCQLDAREPVVAGVKILIMSRSGCAPAEPAPGRLFVVGDSHAGHYNVMLAQLVLRTGREVYIYSTGGCAVLGLREPMAADGACHQAEQGALDDALGRLRQGDTVFFSSLRLLRLGDQWARYDEAQVRQAAFSSQAAVQRKAAELQAVALLQPFAAKGARIVFPGPTPVFRAPAFRCADWFNKMNPICDGGVDIWRSEIERYRAPVLQAFASIAASVPGVSVWDPMPILCPGAVCSASRDGQPLFFDGDHLSAYANNLLLPDFMRFTAALH